MRIKEVLYVLRVVRFRIESILSLTHQNSSSLFQIMFHAKYHRRGRALLHNIILLTVSSSLPAVFVDAKLHWIGKGSCAAGVY